MKSGWSFCLLLAAIGFLLCPSLVGASQTGVPNPLGYISDYAGVLSEEWKARIRSVCKDLEKKTGVEMVVVTIRSTEPYFNVKEFANALYKEWRIGSAQKEHGVLVLASIEKGQATVTLGRNMIRVITPPLLEKVKRDYIVPSFRLGHYGEGLYQTVVNLAAVSQDIRVGTPLRKHRKGVGFWLTLFTIVGGVSVFWWMSRPDKRHPFRRIQAGEYWGTGQGGFSGNFGGFGGAMGGEEWRK